MRTALIAILLIGCAEHGETPPIEPVTLETTFVPTICVGGEPNDPSCLINRFVLGDLTAPSGTFIVRPEGAGLAIPDLTLIPGELQWAISHLQIGFGDQTLDLDLDVRLQDSAHTLDPIPLPSSGTTITLRFESLPL